MLGGEMKRKAIKKVISVLLPMLTLLILSSCNNGVDNDLANAAISNIRSVVEAAGLKAEGYSTADTFGYQGSPIYIEGTEKFVDVYVDFEKDYVEKTPVLRYNPKLKEVEKKIFLGFSKKKVYRLEMEYVSGDDNYDRLDEAYNKLLQSGSLISTFLSDDAIRKLYIKNSIELKFFNSRYSLVPKEEYSGNPETYLEEQEKRESILKTDVKELTPLIEDLDPSRVNNLDEETLVRDRDLLLKRVADNRSTFRIDIDIDIKEVRKQNLQVTNEDIENWTDSDFQYLLTQILQVDKLPRNTEVGFSISYEDKNQLNAYRSFNFKKQ
jgi:lipoprotein